MIYVISDLHGYSLQKVKDLFLRADFTEEDTCYVLGDVIDRGDDGIELLMWMMEQPNIKLILGNHEDMLLACDFLFLPITEENLGAITDDRKSALELWMMNGADSTIAGLKRISPEKRLEILQYLKDAPLYAEVNSGGKDYVLVHGGLDGFDSKKPLEEYFPRDLLWSRPTLSVRYYRDKITVFGHTPTLYYGKRFEGKPIVTDTWINIDVGAARKLPPLLLRLDDMREFYAE